ncbi:MAG: pseudouridine synthase [Marinoscillum sp.]
MLEILYQDDVVVAINKPPGLLVHRSPIAKDVEVFAMQLLRDQLGQHVYPAHRLDRKTSGVLLFALNAESHKLLQQQFAEKTVQKTYYAIVRGFTPTEGTIDYALKREDGKSQEAVTHYQLADQAELPVPFGKHSTSRYSLLKITPETGRMHQIRKHMAHIFHPIIGDRPHGCNKQNRLFKETWNMSEMMLHARSLTFTHPVNQQQITVSADFSMEFHRMMALMGFQDSHKSSIV